MISGILSYGTLLFLNQACKEFSIEAHTGELIEKEASKPKANVHFDH